MIKKILLGLGAALIVFLIYVSTKPSAFHYERSAVINASAEKIYPYLNNFKIGGQWSPYEKMDPSMKKTYSGPEMGVGAKMDFDGNKDVGSGHLEILKVEPNSLVELRLEMLKPMHASNLIQYKLTPEGTGTRFTWSMSGEGGFMGKLVSVLIDCEKMVGDQFSQGIENLKAIVESK